MHRILSRQLKHVLGLTTPEAVGEVLAEAGRLAEQPGLSPVLAQALGGLNALFDRISATYDQNDRDHELRARSLKISSEELTIANKQMHIELASRNRAIETLRSTIERLLPASHSGGMSRNDDADLELLTSIVAELVQQSEANRLELVNQKFALDQHAIVSITDTDGRILYANEKFCEITKFRRFELLGETHAIINSGYHPKEFFENMWATIRMGNVWHGEIKNRNKFGGEYWVAATIVPLLDAQGMPDKYIAIRTDITERKAVEAELQVSIRKANASNQAKSEFLANMSHEIRTPLNGIIGMTDLTLDTKLDADQREFLTLVRNSSESLMMIINDILDFSKIEAGRMEMESIPFDLQRVVNETINTFTFAAQNKKLKLFAELDPDMPQSVLGDPGRLRQVLVNLIGNAIKFTDKGQIALHAKLQQRVKLENGQEAIDLQLSVQDTGIGIAPEKHIAIFEAFTQEDSSTTRNFGGTGLGLTISARIVHLLGGKIWMESQPGMGSTFYFTVRMLVDPHGKRTDVHRNSIPAQGDISQSISGAVEVPLNVLLAEDHPVNQKLVANLLSRWGHRVTIANNGQEALDWFDKQGFDVILMDVQMPVMNGLDASREIRLREQQRGLPATLIIALTANAMKSDSDACRDAGMNDFMTKPINAKAFRERLIQVGQQKY